MPPLFLKPKYVWFPVNLKGAVIPDPSGQLAELIVYITSTRVDLYSHQFLLDSNTVTNQPKHVIKSSRSSDAYMRQWTNHHWFR